MLIERDRSECLTQCHLVVICCLVVLVSSVATGAPPNIVLILVDDMGYTGVGCFGNRHVATPNIDRLATEGAKLTSAYVMPQCTPTRAALLTGQHTARTGMWHVPGYHFPYARVKEPAYVMGLPKESVTVAEVLRDRDYKTACIGKWHLHLGTDGNYGRLYEKSKKDHGFDIVQSLTDRGTQDKGVTMLTDEAIKFIGRNRANPFFLYLSHYTVHTPVQATPARIAKYRQAGFPAAGPGYLEPLTRLATVVLPDLRVLDAPMAGFPETGPMLAGPTLYAIAYAAAMVAAAIAVFPWRARQPAAPDS